MENKYIQTLDDILLSHQVIDNFYREYNTDVEFKKWINKEIPAVEKCENQQQNNPWHIYNVLGHILRSVQEMNRLTKGMEREERRLLAYTMFLHDIGKPEKHITRMKDGAVIDSFFDHNIASAKIAREVLPKLGFSVEETKVITKLIYKHDIFMFIKPFKTNNPHWRELSPKIVEGEVADLNEVGDGNRLLGFLLKVGRADSLAQNPKLAKDSLKLLDLFEGEYKRFLRNKEIEND